MTVLTEAFDTEQTNWKHQGASRQGCRPTRTDWSSLPGAMELVVEEKGLRNQGTLATRSGRPG